ncbi:hypothetical protein IWW45_008714, partial [Coemansia sp. RSA 485]
MFSQSLFRGLKASLAVRPLVRGSQHTGLRWSSGAANNSSDLCSSSSALYGDTVPMSQKEEIMDEVYCKVADRYDAVIDILSVFMNTMWKRNFVKQIKPQPGA